METPDLMDEDDVEVPEGDDSSGFEEALGPSEEDEDAAKEDNFETASVDLGVSDSDDIIAGFDGIEEDVEDEKEEETSGGRSETETIQEAIEDGMAEVAVVGLEGAERDRVRTEMLAVASKFKLGYFGEQVAQKYLKRDLDDIPPEYGLAAAMLAFAAVTLYKRPDGEEKVREAVDALRDRFSEDGQSSADTTPQGDTDE